jgi:thiol-disulfide isomerase/thioredoxin
MIRKSLLLLLVTSLLATAMFMAYATIDKINHKKLTGQNLKSLPNLLLFDLDSARFYLSSDRKKILIYFNSECGNCQHEIEEIIKNKKSFEGLDIVFMSSESISAIRSFAEKKYSSNLIDIKFTKISGEHAYQAFGDSRVPQIFIYASDDALIKQFQGETKIDSILPYL